MVAARSDLRSGLSSRRTWAMRSGMFLPSAAERRPRYLPPGLKKAMSQKPLRLCCMTGVETDTRPTTEMASTVRLW